MKIDDLLAENETLKKRVAELETIQTSSAYRISTLSATVEDMKANWRALELAAETTKRKQAEAAVEQMQNWLDKHGKFVNSEFNEVKINTKYPRVWYVETDEMTRYPFSQMVKR